MSLFTDLASRAGSAAQTLWEVSGQLVQPSLRLGVTGLARSGKTVFTTALVHHLTRNTQLPAFRASAEGRIRQAHLAHQPDDDGAAVSLRGACGGADQRTGAGRNPPTGSASSGGYRFRAPGRLASGTGDPRPRHRRLSGRMAARLALLDAVLRGVVAADRWRRAGDPTGAGIAARLAREPEGARSRRPGRRRWRPRGKRGFQGLSRRLCAPAPRPSRRRRRAGSSCRAILPGRRH